MLSSIIITVICITSQLCILYIYIPLYEKVHADVVVHYVL